MRGTITVNAPGNADKSEPPKTFTFDIVFGPKCKQVDVYNEVARPIVDCVLEGYNGQFIPLQSVHICCKLPCVAKMCQL